VPPGPRGLPTSSTTATSPAHAELVAPAGGPGLPGTPGGNPGTSPHLVNVPVPHLPTDIPADTATRINIAACMADAGAEDSGGEAGAAQSLEAPGNGATMGAAASDQAAEVAHSAAESTVRVGRPLAGTQTILDRALFPGVAQIPNVYAYRSLLNARGLAFGVAAKGLGFVGTAIDAGLAVNDLANGRDFEASLNLVSAGMGTAMLVQPEVTPVALPIAFIAKGLPSLGNSYAKMLYEGTSIPMPLSP
jgi:hypothetical protein